MRRPFQTLALDKNWQMRRRKGFKPQNILVLQWTLNPAILFKWHRIAAGRNFPWQNNNQLKAKEEPVASALFFFSLKMGEVANLNEEILSSSASSEPNYTAIRLHQEPQVHLEFRCILFLKKKQRSFTPIFSPRAILYRMPWAQEMNASGCIHVWVQHKSWGGFVAWNW